MTRKRLRQQKEKKTNFERDVCGATPVPMSRNDECDTRTVAASNRASYPTAPRLWLVSRSHNLINS